MLEPLHLLPLEALLLVSTSSISTWPGRTALRAYLTCIQAPALTRKALVATPLEALASGELQGIAFRRALALALVAPVVPAAGALRVIEHLKALVVEHLKLLPVLVLSLQVETLAILGAEALFLPPLRHYLKASKAFSPVLTPSKLLSWEPPTSARTHCKL